MKGKRTAKLITIASKLLQMTNILIFKHISDNLILQKEIKNQDAIEHDMYKRITLPMSCIFNDRNSENPRKAIFIDIQIPYFIVN